MVQHVINYWDRVKKKCEGVHIGDVDKDCGAEIETTARNMLRCKECRVIYNREMGREYRRRDQEKKRRERAAA